MKYLLSFIRPYRFRLIYTCILKVIGACADISLPLILAMVIEVAVSTGDTKLVLKYGILMLFITIISTGANALCSLNAGKVSEQIGQNLRLAFFKHKQSLTVRNLRHYSYSVLTTEIIYDIDNVAKFVSTCTRMGVRSLSLAVGGIIIASTIDPYITAILVVTMSFILFVSRKIFKANGKLYRRVSEGIDESTSTIREAITGIKTIKSFAKQQKEQNSFNQKAEIIYNAQVKAGTNAAILGPLITLISNIGLIIVLFASGYRVDGGLLEVVELTSLVVYINLFITAMAGFSNMFVRFAKANASANRIHEFLNISPSEKDIHDTPVQHGTAVTVENLTFKFKKRVVLDDISFNIEKGKTLAIVGETGSGKTTLAEILTGIYENYTGDIFLNGQNIRNLPSTTLAKFIGVARQKFDIFTDTIEKNIILDKAFDQNYFDYAIKNAQIADFIGTVGKDLKIRQSGTNLSGGQRQRINLARLFYNDADTLVLDDVSSALDTGTNAKLNDALAKLYGKKTFIIISNKINSIKNADNIIVLQEGKIIASGTHEVLEKTCDTYNKLSKSVSEEDYIYEE